MKLDPKKTVFLVIDMQKDFYADGFNAAKRGKPVAQMQALPEKINAFTDAMRGKGVRIVFTRFVYDPKRSPRNFIEITETTKASNWLCVVGTEGAELAGVNVKEQDIILDKLSYDCFAGTDLLSKLRSWGIENVVIAGVRTEICVLATAERSFAEDFRTFVVSDLVATYDDKQAIADNVLESLKYAGYVVDHKELEWSGF